MVLFDKKWRYSDRLLTRRNFVNAVTSAFMVSVKPIVAVASLNEEPKALVTIHDSGVDPSLKHINVTVTLAQPVKHTVYALIATRNGDSSSPNERAIEGIDYLPAEKLVAFYPGGSLVRSVKFDLTGNGRLNRWFNIVGKNVIGGPSFKANGRIVFTTGASAGKEYLQEPPRRMPTKGSRAFSLNIEEFSAGESGFLNNIPIWRDRLQHGRVQLRNKEVGYYAPNQWRKHKSGLELFVRKLSEPVYYNIDGKNMSFSYHSSVVTTQHLFSQLYGSFEIEAQMPSARGTWPAFWLLPVDRSWPPEIRSEERRVG